MKTSVIELILKSYKEIERLDVKIFMLGWELPPYHTGGLGVVCYQMCKQLARSGADIDFILPFTADFSHIDFMNIKSATPREISEIAMAGGSYDSHQYRIFYEDGSEEISDMREQQDMFVESVVRMVKYAEFDVLHAHDWLTFKAAMAAKQVTGKPLIAHVHATEYDRSGGNYGNPLVREIEYSAFMMADKILTVSENTRQVLLSQYDVDPAKVETVHNSMDIDINHINEDGNEYAYLTEMKNRGYKIVTNAGRMTIQKGITHLLKAAKLVIDKQPKTIFLIAGGGDQYLELVEMAADLGIAKNVVFTGYLNGTGKQWRDAFKVADLFVMPSVNEPFGITPIEAIGYGAPVLLSKQSGVSELLSNVLKIDFWDIDEMANQILAVVEHEALANELYDNSYQEYLGLSWEKSANRMLDIYKHHIDESSENKLRFSSPNLAGAN